MKNTLFALCCLSAWPLLAQNEQDALNYSTIGAGGSARTLGMAGSFSAIGADASAAFMNPAGIATMRRNEFNMGIQLANNRSISDYLNTTLTDNKFNFNIPSMALTIAKIKYDGNGKPVKTGLTNVSYGFAINRLANFHNRVAFDAPNTASSITDYFAEKANQQAAVPFDLFLGSLPSIAYSAGAIENLLDGGGSPSMYYVSRYIDSNRNNQQTGTLTTKGSIYESQFSLGLNFSNKIQMGIGLVYSTLRYSKEFDILEVDNQKRNARDLESLTYNESIYDRGNGFGAKLGAIFRPNDQFRLAASIHTPKTYNIKEEYGYNLTTVFEPGANVQREVNAFTEPFNTYAYKVTTPVRISTGLGFVLNKSGLFNVETEFYNYGSTRMKADDYAFTAENNNIRRMYKSVVVLRMGAEFNIPDANRKNVFYRVRMGFANYPSPYSSRAAGIDPVLKKAQNLLTGGFGYREEDMFIDFALTYGGSSNYFTPYITNSSLFPAATVTNRQKQVALSVTMGWNFE